MLDTTIPYEVLIVDDQMKPSSWPSIVAAHLRYLGYSVDQARSPQDVRLLLKRKEYDIFLIDMELNAKENGIDITHELRQKGYVQPIILATGEQAFKAKPILDYAPAFALGPVAFHIKSDDDSEGITALVQDATGRVDQFRRAIRLMREAGLLGKTVTIGEETYEVDDLLRSNEVSNNLAKNLREALHALLVDILTKHPRE